MKEQKPMTDLNLIKETCPFFGQTLLRDILIPNLLGNETNEILYWAGKEIARQYPLSSIEETILFFERAGFGNLELQKRDKQILIYRLTGTLVESRLNVSNDPSFNLEAGFLAEQIQQQENIYTEAVFEIQLKKETVLITLKQDTKDSELLEKSESYFSLASPHKDLEISPLSEKNEETPNNTLITEATSTSSLKRSDSTEGSSIFNQLPSRTAKHLKKK